MHVLFSVRNGAYVRHYDPVLRVLTARGHAVRLATDGALAAKPWPPHVEALARECPGLTLERTPSTALDPWYELATAARQNLFHARFLEPDYGDTPALRTRAAAKAPGFVRALLEGPLAGATGRRAVTAAVRTIERSTPIPPSLLDYLRARRPDVLVLTPLLVLRTSQFDLLRAARALGIPTVLGVASWDHLSSKGLLHDIPDRVLVWNDTQRDEAVALHGVDANRITVTGAQVFDTWLDHPSPSPRHEFLARVGLPPDRPYVLYVGSALFEGSPSEVLFVRRWLEGLRHRPGLRDVGVLVRPHFKRGTEWLLVDAKPESRTVVWPPAGEVPVDAGSKAGYVDSLAHAAAVVGLNTSALIEGAALGKPVLSPLLPEFYGNQEGTLHFRYLSRGPRALLHTATDLDGHLSQLDDILNGRDPDPYRSARFVRHFVRPGDPAVAATALVADAIEAAGRLTPEPAAPRGAVPEWILRPLARAAVRRVERRRAALEQIDREKRLAKERLRDARRAEHRAKRRERADAEPEDLPTLQQGPPA